MLNVSGDRIKGWVYIGIGVAVVGLIIWIMHLWDFMKKDPQGFADSYPNLAAFALTAGWLPKTSSGNTPDITGEAGVTASSAAQVATYTGSQGDYDVHLAAYAKNHGFATSLSAQGTMGWPWKSYAEYLEDMQYSQGAGLWGPTVFTYPQ